MIIILIIKIWAGPENTPRLSLPIWYKGRHLVWKSVWAAAAPESGRALRQCLQAKPEFQTGCNFQAFAQNHHRLAWYSEDYSLFTVKNLILKNKKMNDYRGKILLTMSVGLWEDHLRLNCTIVPILNFWLKMTRISLVRTFSKKNRILDFVLTKMKHFYKFWTVAFSICLIHLLACPWGSIRRGHRLEFEIIIPLSIEKESEGRPAIFQSRIFTGSPKTVERLKPGEI